MKAGDVKVAEISQPGSVIGEMGLFLKEKRTASLISQTDVKICKVKKDNLKEFTDHNPDFFMTVAKSLAEKTKDSFSIIKHLSQEKNSIANLDEKNLLKKDTDVEKLGLFSKKILDLWEKKEYPAMTDYMKNYTPLFKKYLKKIEE